MHVGSLNATVLTCMFSNHINLRQLTLCSHHFWETDKTHELLGGWHKISEAMCAPGTIGTSVSRGFSITLKCDIVAKFVSAGARMSVTCADESKPVDLGVLKELQINAGFAYTFRYAATFLHGQY